MVDLNPLIEYVTKRVGERWKKYGTRGGEVHRDISFPIKVIESLMEIVKNEGEANMAIDVIFNKIYENKENGVVTDFHAYDYGSEITYYHVYTERALELARNKETLEKICG